MHIKSNTGRKIVFILIDCLVLVSAARKIHPNYPTPKRYFTIIDCVALREPAKEINRL